MRLPGELRIAGTDDGVKPFILVANSHDGSLACRALNTAIRVVCSNTLTLALRTAGADSIAVKHTERIHNRLVDAQEMLGFAVTQHRKFEAHMNILAEKKFNRRQFDGDLDRVLGTASRQVDESVPRGAFSEGTATSAASRRACSARARSSSARPGGPPSRYWGALMCRGCGGGGRSGGSGGGGLVGAIVLISIVVIFGKSCG